MDPFSHKTFSHNNFDSGSFKCNGNIDIESTTLKVVLRNRLCLFDLARPYWNIFNAFLSSFLLILWNLLGISYSSLIVPLRSCIVFSIYSSLKWFFSFLAPLQKSCTAYLCVWFLPSKPRIFRHISPVVRRLWNSLRNGLLSAEKVGLGTDKRIRCRSSMHKNVPKYTTSRPDRDVQCKSQR